MGEEHRTVVIGAGPAGLTAAYELLARGVPVRVFEADEVVGGISRTVERDGWRFDIGGHRFFTKVPRVEEFWHEILPEEDFLLRPRMSRIYYRGALFDYPLSAVNALRNLGVREAALCMASYARARLRPPKDQSHFEGWVSARFGWRLYSMFFKTYTEKVWGMPAHQLQADWAAQRIKNLSLAKAVRNALLPRSNRKDVTSLIEEFQYPKLGPGMMWERCAEEVQRRGGQIDTGTWVTAVHRDPARRRAVAVTVNGAGQRSYPVGHVVSSMPISELVAALRPAAPPEVLAAAAGLRHRDFLTIALVVPAEFSFPDNWIYVHDPAVKVGRIQNFGSWSPHLVKDGRTCLGLEYFVFEDDQTWRTPDPDLIAAGTHELERLGLIRPGAVEAGYVVRMPKAYPVYDERYQHNVAVIRDWLAREVPNVHPVGRNGMHRYNNQDHSMLTAMLTAENIACGTTHDVWSVNVEQDYHEDSGPGDGDGRRGTGRSAPIVPARPGFASTRPADWGRARAGARAAAAHSERPAAAPRA
ncbi:NAD(P)/FAD-dependent oxidoreductase [Micromonospora sp. NPDC023737]|uniref:NAD(P)/FAD-dependent oxidoreductase n=1 Tax=unclassified Micromonospora TaxID=2617518 RepID=UPI0033FBC069